MFGSESGEVRAVSRKQLVQHRVVRDAGRPAVSGRDSGVELGVGVQEPLWPESGNEDDPLVEYSNLWICSSDLYRLWPET